MRSSYIYRYNSGLHLNNRMSARTIVMRGRKWTGRHGKHAIVHWIRSSAVIKTMKAIIAGTTDRKTIEFLDENKLRTVVTTIIPSQVGTQYHRTKTIVYFKNTYTYTRLIYTHIIYRYWTIVAFVLITLQVQNSLNSKLCVSTRFVCVFLLYFISTRSPSLVVEKRWHHRSLIYCLIIQCN